MSRNAFHIPPLPHFGVALVLAGFLSAPQHLQADPRVAAGSAHTLFVMEDGTVLSSGWNEFGQLGDGSKQGRGKPLPVAGLSGVKAVAAGYYHSLFLKNDGTVWGGGYAWDGQLGNYYIDGILLEVQEVPGLTEVKAIASGGRHSLFLKTDGSVWTSGFNVFGQLGNGTKRLGSPARKVMEGVRDIFASATSSFFLRIDGTVLAAGDNRAGQLGDATTENRATPVPVTGLSGVLAVAAGADHTLFLTADGTVFATGANTWGAYGNGETNSGINTPVPVRTGVKAIAAGDGCSFFVTMDGTLTAAGNNQSGQLGDGTRTNRPNGVMVMTGVEAVTAGEGHTCIIREGGAVMTAGGNFSGQLGDGRMGYGTRPAPVAGLIDVKAMSAGFGHSLFLDSDGRAWGVGGNTLGALGDGTREDRYLPVRSSFTGVSSLCAGWDYSVFIKANGSAYASGDNIYSPVGAVASSDPPAPVALPGIGATVTASAGSGSTHFLKPDGTVMALGSNFWGALGDGTTTDRSYPIQIPVPGSVRALAAGWDHTLFLMADGTVRATGADFMGELGKAGAEERIWNGQAFLTRLPSTIPGVDGIAAVAAGQSSSIFLKADGTVLAAGAANNDGSPDPNTGTPRRYIPSPIPGATGVKAISEGSGHSLFLKTDGTVLAVGDNYFGQLGDGTINGRAAVSPVPGLEGIQAVAAGENFSLFLKVDGTVVACGSNQNGRAGLGDYDRTTPVEVLNLQGDPDAIWRRDQFGEPASDPAVSGWMADPDKDGLVNLLERAFNLPALEAGQPVLAENGGAGLPWISTVRRPQGIVLVLRYIRLKAAANSGLIYTPEFSSTPGSGWAAATGPETVVPVDANWERVTLEDTPEQPVSTFPARFARVRISWNQ